MKKLLIGAHFGGHDLNVSLYDGKNFKYLHDERISTVKNANLESLDKALHYVKNWIGSHGYDVSNILSIACTIGERSGVNSFPENEQTLVSKKNLFVDIDCYQIDHHYAHALSAFPITDTTNHYVNDGHGDWHKYLSIFKKDILTNYLKEGLNGNSFGWLLEELCEKLKIGTWKDVGKLMGLIGYGKIDHGYIDKYKDQDLEHSHIYSHVREFLRYTYDKGIFHQTNEFFHSSNYIATLHKLYEEKFLNYLKKYFKETDVFSYSGGIAQRIVLNTEYKKIFPNMITLPHANDSGLSLGCVEWLRRFNQYDPIDVGPFPFIQADEHPGDVSDDTIKKTAELLAQNKIVLWYQGHGEIGPRALGNRSILMNPMAEKKELNRRVKKREWFRPYGASVLENEYKEYVDLDWVSPYMLYNSKVTTHKFPAITHEDGTCRIQTVSENHEKYYSLLSEFKKLTGYSVLLNTSFNLQGSAIVGKVSHAMEVFDKTDADVLVLGDEIITK